jgi:di/tricarboxylate transporter
MNPEYLPYLSLAALAVAVVVSFTARLNVGILAVAFAWFVGVVIGEKKLDDVLAGFPATLFLMLTGVTLLFTHAQANGTLDRIARHGVRICRGNVGMIPIMFFGLALVLSSVGPGAIAITALLAPMAMGVAGRTGVSAFLMTIMMANGAQAGTLSPIAPTGLILSKQLTDMGMQGIEGVQWQTYVNVLIAHTVVAFVGYFLLGGWRLFGRTYTEAAASSEDDRLDRKHWVTIGVIAMVICAVIFLKVNVGMAAFVGVVLLFLLRVTAQGDIVKQMPWGPILMVCGVTVLVSLVETTGGMNIFTGLLARFAGKETVTGMIAFVSGSLSVYSSTSGVILPMFLKTVPGLATRLDADSLAIIYSICVGGHLVDISPLSTTGALCIAAAPASEDYRSLFNKLLAWGLSMSVVGAIVSYIFFGLLHL